MTQNGFNTKRPSKCMFNRCDWPYEGFHICVDFSTPEPAPQVHHGPVWSEAEKKEIGDRVRARSREKYAERDVKIVEMYVIKLMGMRDIAEEVGSAYQTVRGVLQRNNIPFRPRGWTPSRPGNHVRGAFN